MRHRGRTVWIAAASVCVAFLFNAGPAAAGSLTPEENTRYLDLDARALQSFSNVDLADYLRLRAKLLEDAPDRPSPADEIGHFADKALGQQFRLNAVSLDLGESDCVVLCNRCIALACASDWDSYYRLCERLRHKDGIVAYKNRNFRTLAEWLPNNLAWGILKDITDDLQTPEGPAASAFAHVVRPKVFEEFPAAPGSKYTRIVFKGSDYKSPDKEVRTETYISREKVAAILPQLKTGDIALVLREAAGGHKGCDHLGVIMRQDDGSVSLLHCAPPRARQEMLSDFLSRFKFVEGFKFLRLQENARDIVSQELARIGSNVKVTSPQAQDDRIAQLRAAREREKAGASSGK